MEDNLLINYLKRNKDYCFYIGRYEFPKKLETINGNFIDLEDNRKKNLLQGSNWSPNFKAVLDSEFRGVKYHREFPLIVRNLKAWRHYSLNHNVTDPDKLDRNYFLADYFFPDHNLVVEIDSDMHDPWYDSARDDYMNVVYGLQVIRLYEFGEPSTEVARIDDFGIALNKLKYSRTFSIDNSDLVLSWFYEKNKDIIDALNIIEANINSSRNGIFDASGYQHLIRDYRTLDRIDEIIKGVYNINVVMEVWNR